MRRNLFFAVLAGVALASCSNDEYIAGSLPSQQPVEEPIELPILFGSLKSNTTRADITGADAANLLGKKFVVYGYKGSNTLGYTSDNTVFDNYLVEYSENTAHTTESNSSNWEYVGKGLIKHAADNGITSQKIKYWDFSKAQYDFIAWSAGDRTAIYEGTPAEGQVLVSAIKPVVATAPATGLAPVYTFKGKSADLTNCYITDLVTVKKNSYDITGNSPVTFHFRQLGTKVRMAIYETVPGYSVRDVKFYSAAASNDASADKARLFTTTENQIYTQGTYSVYYPVVDNPSAEGNNQARVKFESDGPQTTNVYWGALNYTIAEEGEQTAGAKFLGRSSATASFAGSPATNYYATFMPNEDGVNLNLRVDYTLESTDGSGEIIEVKGATAQVPSIYAAWRPGFAYTYLFKISDKTNGHTGDYDPTKPDDTTTNSDPAGLYPITFDAVVENAEIDGTQETITTISTPSITTYQEGSDIVNNNEYVSGVGPIYVTVSDGNTDETPDLAHGHLVDLTGKAALYRLSKAGTEADVIDAMQIQDDGAATGTVKGRNGLVLTAETNELVSKIQYGVDGNTIDLTDGTKKKAMKFTGAADNYYAFVYTKTASTSATAKYEAVTKAVDDPVNGYYRYKLEAAAAGDVQKGVKYFANADASTGMLTVFVGQLVNNVYTRTGAGTPESPYAYDIASGYAVTGTHYYYTLDKGQTYKEAHNVAYADFKTATLYTDAACTTAKTETAPVNGKAYYYKDASDNIFWCIILPEQTTGKYVINETADKVACGSTDKAVNGMTYFDKYTQNNGVYYTKVIKVQ